MKFTYKVYYEDDSRYSFGKIRYRLVRAASKAEAMAKFLEKFSIKPIGAE